MTPLERILESILFVAGRPLSIAKLAEVTDAKKTDVTQAIATLAEAYDKRGSGLRILQTGDAVQLMTAPESAKTVSEFVKDETTGELTRPALETLTIIAYRGPVTKPEIEQIRGINCSLILRNLLMRGLVEASEDKRLMQTTYRVSMEFLRHLGVSSTRDLPDFQKLTAHPLITSALTAPSSTTQD